MKQEFIRCEFCSIPIPLEICQLAAYHTIINGKDYIFCCQKCAERYTQKRKGKTK
ncbi:MAG: transcriptional regulator [Candidatus Bathyarchaeales archaeon]